MGKLSELLPSSSQFLRADDVPDGKSIRLVVDSIKVETIKNDEGEAEKPVLFFTGKDKGLVLNRTNLDVLIKLFGDNIDAPTGKQIILYRTFANFRGQTVPALRLRGVEEATPEDDIPF